MRDLRPLVIRLNEPEWDLATRGKLQFLLAAATDRPQVFVDMRAVTYLDAACLGTLAFMQKERLRRGGYGPAGLIVASPELRRLLKLVGFDTAWPLFDSLDQALSGHSPDDDLSLESAV